jgi:alkylation response protein AidB-like acyl-CoA dehydrogenase
VDSLSIASTDAAPEVAEAFARDVVAPLVQRPEQVLPSSDLDGLIEKAAAAGLLATSLSPEAVRHLARVNGGVAFVLHRVALAARLRVRVNLPGDSTAVAVSLHGHYGLGRQALPRLLAGRPLGGEDVALLADCFDLAAHDRVVIGPEWETLIVAGFDGADIVWQELPRAGCDVAVQPNSHGFDELETSTVRSRKPIAGAADTSAYVEALYLDGLGMAAIAAGLVDHGLQLARAYAGQRRQSGALIDAFPAVQQMLAQISATARAGSQHLAWFRSQPPTVEALADLCAVRLAFHPACCVAANNAIQVLGGRGYMQDFGPEKLVRDANTLRVLGGTPTELCLFVAESERAR